DDIVRVNRVGPGDEVFLTGLFSHRPGNSQNIPIIRVGNIAAMPGEPIQTPHGAFQAYLVEARSTPAMSGSPVFLNVTGLRDIEPPVHEMGNAALVRGLYLLGVGYGHYNDTRRRRPATALQKINTGIALVVPTKRISDLVRGTDEVVRRRQKQSAI